MSVNIKVIKQISPKKSILICGLPGIAYIGKLSVDYLVKELNAVLVGEIYSHYFPPYVLINKDGIVELLKNELYYLKTKGEFDFLFLTGNAQVSSPEGQYKITNLILEHVINLGVQKVFSVAAFLTGKPFETPKVYGASTNTKLVEMMKKHKIVVMDEGMISGVNGLIIGLAERKNLDGICLLGETRGYRTTSGQYLLDAKAVRAVLDVLTEILTLKVDMEPLDKQIEEMDEIVSRMEEIKRHVREEMKGRTKTDSSSRYIT